MKTLCLAMCLLVWPAVGLAADPKSCACQVSCNGAWASGTAVEGAPAGSTFIITARHVADATSGIVRHNGRDYAARVVARSPSSDLAVLVVGANLPCATIHTGDPTIDTRFVFYGSGLDFNTARSGTVSRCTGSALSVKMSSHGGDSGGGCLTDSGVLLGVLYRGSDTAERSTCVPASCVRGLVSTIPNGMIAVVAQTGTDPDQTANRSISAQPANPQPSVLRPTNFQTSPAPRRGLFWRR